MDSFDWMLNRRTVLQRGAVLLLGGASHRALGSETESKRSARIGLITDLHYADKKRSGSRYYRESLAKLEEAAKRFQESRADMVVELGDFVDAAGSVKEEQKYLNRINKEFLQLPGDKHYVLGNHCVTTFTKAEFLNGIERKKSWYSFDKADYHFIVLDSCFRSDGKPYGRRNFSWTDPNIPAPQVEWLQADLKATSKKVIVLAHQRLDVGKPYGVKNAPAIRKILEQSKKVRLVLQGHSHKNDLKTINGIHYCTLVAMVEGTGVKSNGYSLMDLYTDGTIRIDGFRKQKDYQWKS